MVKYLHCPSLFRIPLSMDIHPNLDPTVIHIIRDFTNPQQRTFFNTAKRLQLKLTLTEHHTFNYKYFYDRKVIPKGLTIKCRPAIDTCNKHFFQNWASLRIESSLKMIKLLTRECERHSKHFTSSISNIMEQLKSICSTTTYVKIKGFL